jgi:hypothetical protein
MKVARAVLRGGKPERAYLSRVVLANASLDTVFHDTLIILFFAINILMDKIKNDKLFLNNSSSSLNLLKLDNDYIKKF